MPTHHYAAALREELRDTLAQVDHYYTLMIEAGEHPNLDRLGYASQMTLDVFRRLLGRPDLGADELAATLREAMTERHEITSLCVPCRVQGDSSTRSWMDVGAQFVANRANENQGARL